MPFAAKLYPKFIENALRKRLDVSSDTLKVMLLSAYTYADAHATMANILAAGTEATGTGYTAGGKTLTSVSLTTTGSIIALTAADVIWTASDITASYAVFYDAQGGTDATNYPITLWDFGGPETTAGDGTYTLDITSLGFARLVTA